MFSIFRLFAKLLSPPPQKSRPNRPVSFARERNRRPRPKPERRVLKGKCYVVDGDTIIIDNTRIRLAGIDAPELDHPYGQKSKWAMVRLCKGQVITAELKEEMSHGRVVATCYLPDGRDLAAELVKQGLAIDWPKFSGGKYRSLEAPDARKRMWRAHYRQMGKYFEQKDFGRPKIHP